MRAILVPAMIVPAGLPLAGHHDYDELVKCTTGLVWLDCASSIRFAACLAVCLCKPPTQVRRPPNRLLFASPLWGPSNRHLCIAIGQLARISRSLPLRLASQLAASSPFGVS